MKLFSYDHVLRGSFLLFLMLAVCLSVYPSKCLGLQLDLSGFPRISSFQGHGAEFLRTNQYDKALSLGEKMVRDEPQALSGYLLQALAYVGKGNPKRAFVLAEKSRKIKPEFGLKIYYSLGRSYALQKRYYRALNCLEKAAEIKKAPQVLKAIGEIYLVRGQIKKAKKYFKQLPASPASYLALSKTFMLEKNYQRSVNFAQKVVDHDQHSTEGYVLLGGGYFMLDRLRPAQAAYLQILRINPQFFMASYYLGLIDLIQGDYDEALDYFQSVTVAFPKAKEPLLGEAVAWHLKGDLDKAKNAAAAVTNAVPGDLLGHFVLGNIYLSESRYNQADLAFKQVAGLFHEVTLPTFESFDFTDQKGQIPPYHSLANLLLREGLFQQTINAVDVALKSSSGENPFLLFTKARALSRLGKFAQVEKIYQLVLKKNPLLPTSFREMGDLEADRGNMGLAIQYYDQAVRLDPKWADPHLRLGRLYLDKGEISKAIGEYQKVVSISPRSAVGYNQLAWVLGEKNKDYKTAITYALKGLEVNSDNMDIQDTLGWLYCKSGDLRRAEKTYASMDMAGIRNPTVFYHIGFVYSKLMKGKKAATAFEHALDLSDEFPEAEETEKMPMEF